MLSYYLTVLQPRSLYAEGMAQLVFARPLDNQVDEQSFARLQAIDEQYAATVGLEPQLSRSSFSFYRRTGHSFIALQADTILGFVLAQSIWNGTRPTVSISHVAVADRADVAARKALLEAVTKSAYDAAVYDLQAIFPQDDTLLTTALTTMMYHEGNKLVYERTLGSRGQY